MKANFERQIRNRWRVFSGGSEKKRKELLSGANDFDLKSWVLNADGGLGPHNREGGGKG